MKITFSSKTIEVTQTFANKASRFGSEEYKMLRTAINDLPGFEVVIKATPVRRRTTISGLTYEATVISHCGRTPGFPRWAAPMKSTSERERCPDPLRKLPQPFSMRWFTTTTIRWAFRIAAGAIPTTTAASRKPLKPTV